MGQYDAASGVIEEIAETTRDIVRKAIPASAMSLGICRNALEALRCIGKAICLSDGNTPGHEMFQAFERDDYLSRSMVNIVRAMYEDKRWVVGYEWFNKKNMNFGVQLLELRSCSGA
jgi:hypothetical protein